MGLWLVLVSPCFRENVVATCKNGPFLCSLDNLLLKNVIVIFFWNQISKWRSFEKKAIFPLLFTFFKSLGKSYTHSFSTYLTRIRTRILLTLLTFLCYQFWKKKYEFIRYGFSLLWVLVLILIRATLEQSIITKCWAKFKLECLLLICTYTNVKFIVICKSRTLTDGGDDSVKYRNCKKHCFLAAAILLFIGKIIITW